MAGKQGTRGEQNRNRRQKEPSMRIRLGKLGEIGSKLTLNLTDCGCDWKGGSRPVAMEGYMEIAEP